MVSRLPVITNMTKLTFKYSVVFVSFGFDCIAMYGKSPVICYRHLSRWQDIVSVLDVIFQYWLKGH